MLKIHQASLDAIAKACLDIDEDIPERHRPRFKEVRREYAGLAFSEVETRRNESDNMAGPNIWVHDITEGRRKVIGLLQEMICLAK
jgi:hypothetical protein